ncbi:MAG: type II secretion system protein, partial [Cyanobium sp.]
PRSRLAFLLSLQQGTHVSPAFTLIELIIVLFIVGVISAAAIPKYLEARKATAAGTAIGEQVGLAKECATFVVTKVGASPNPNCSTNGGLFSRSWSQYGSISGLNCLDQTGLSGTKVTVQVSSLGDFSCSIL